MKPASFPQPLGPNLASEMATQSLESKWGLVEICIFPQPLGLNLASEMATQRVTGNPLQTCYRSWWAEDMPTMWVPYICIYEHGNVTVIHFMQCGQAGPMRNALQRCVCVN